MDAESLRHLLDDVREGRVEVSDAVDVLRDLPFQDIGDAKIDHHRTLRTGMPEAILAQGKTPRQVADSFSSLAARSPLAMATRADRLAYEAVREVRPDAVFFERARIIALGEMPAAGDGYVVVATGGTADLPVAEEAAVTLELLGHRVERLFDVGVAGIHRGDSRRRHGGGARQRGQRIGLLSPGGGADQRGLRRRLQRSGPAACHAQQLRARRGRREHR
jgi:pyridinium-3,5-biscarboxylic acid mononucleotide synthase